MRKTLTTMALVSAVNLTVFCGSAAAGWEPEVERWADLIDEYAELHDLDPRLIAAVMTIESHGDPKARSYSGATGLMQVMPYDPYQFSNRPTVEELFDPATNLDWGARILASQVRWAEGDLVMAVGAYFDGRERARNRRPRTVAYARKVLSLYDAAYEPPQQSGGRGEVKETIVLDTPGSAEARLERVRYIGYALSPPSAPGRVRLEMIR